MTPDQPVGVAAGVLTDEAERVLAGRGVAQIQADESVIEAYLGQGPDVGAET